MDQGAGRVVEPIALGLSVARNPGLTASDLLGEDQDADVPVRDVPEHAGDGPVLVHGNAERIIVQPFDQGPQTIALAGVRFDVGAIVSHWPGPFGGR